MHLTPGVVHNFPKAVGVYVRGGILDVVLYRKRGEVTIDRVRY